MSEQWLARAEIALQERLSRLQTRRLGERFEANLFSLLETHPDVTEFRSNVAIGRIGEADALLRLKNAPQRLIHLEVAVKFYLCTETGGSRNPADFIGPGLKDSLAKKLTRIEDHQLQVLKQSEDESLREAESQAWVSGILFYRYDRKSRLGQSFTYPESIEPNHLRGIWVHVTDLEALLQRQNIEKGTYFESKSEWIRDREPQEFLKASHLSDRINEHFKTDTHPIQCEILTPGGRAVRLFVMRNSWPSENVDPNEEQG